MNTKRTMKGLRCLAVCVLLIAAMLLAVACNPETGTKKFSVAFYPNNGESSQSIEVEKDGKVTAPPFTKTDDDGAALTIAGWYPNSDLSGTKYDFDTPVTSSFSLYAKWATAAEVSADAFRTAHSAVLGLTASSVAIGNKAAALAALTAFDGLGADAKALLSSEKTLLDGLVEKIAALELAAAKTAKLASVPALGAYTQSDYTEQSWAEFSSAIDADTSAINACSTVAQVAAYEITASADMLVAKSAEAESFRTAHQTILGLSSDAQISDKAAVNAALAAYNALDLDVKALLSAEKQKLDGFFSQITALEVAAVNSAITSEIRKIEVVGNKVVADTVPVSAYSVEEIDEILDEITFTEQEILFVEEAFTIFAGLDSAAQSLVEDAGVLIAASAQVDYFKMLLFIKDSFDTEHGPQALPATRFDPDVAFQTELLGYLTEFIQKYDAHQGYIQEFYDQIKEYSLTTSVKLDGLIIQRDAEVFRLDHALVLALTLSGVTEGHTAAIESALAEYDELANAVKALLLTEKAKIDSLLIQLDILALAQDQAAADAVAAVIAALPTTVTIHDKAKIEAARELFDALGSAAQALVSNYAVLTTAEGKLEIVIAAAQNNADAALLFCQDHAGVLALTARTITLSDKSALEAAVQAYSLLNAEAKALLAEEKALLDRLTDKIEEMEHMQAAEDFKTAHADIFETELSDISIEIIDYLGEAKGLLQTAIDEYNALDAEVKAYLISEKAHMDALMSKINEFIAAAEQASAFRTTHAAALILELETVEVEDKPAVIAALEAYDLLGAIVKEILSEEKLHLNGLSLQIAILEGNGSAAKVLAIISGTESFANIDWRGEEIFEIISTQGFADTVNELWGLYEDLDTDFQVLVTNSDLLLTAKFMLDLHVEVIALYFGIVEKEWEYSSLYDRDYSYVLENYSEIIGSFNQVKSSLENFVDRYLPYAATISDIAWYTGAVSEQSLSAIDFNIRIIELSKVYYDIVKDIPLDGTLDETNYLPHKAAAYALLRERIDVILDSEASEISECAILLIKNVLLEDKRERLPVLTLVINEMFVYELEAGNEVVIALNMHMDIIFTAMDSGSFNGFEEKYDAAKSAYAALEGADKTEFDTYFGKLTEYLELCKRVFDILEDDEDIATIFFDDVYNFINEIDWRATLSVEELLLFGDKIVALYGQFDADRRLMAEVDGGWERFLILYDEISSWNSRMKNLYNGLVSFGDITPLNREQAEQLMNIASALGEQELNRVIYFGGSIVNIYDSIVEMLSFDDQILSGRQLIAYQKMLYWMENLSIDNIEQAERDRWNSDDGYYYEYNAFLYSDGPRYLRSLVASFDSYLNECASYYSMYLLVNDIDDAATWDFIAALSNEHLDIVINNIRNLQYKNELENMDKFIGAANSEKIMTILSRMVSYYGGKIVEYKTAYDLLESGQKFSAEMIAEITSKHNIFNCLSPWITNYSDYNEIMVGITSWAIAEVKVWADIDDVAVLLQTIEDWFYKYCSNYEMTDRIISFILSDYEKTGGKGKDEVIEGPSATWIIFVDALFRVGEEILSQEAPDFDKVYVLCVIFDRVGWRDEKLSSISGQMQDLYWAEYHNQPDPEWDSETKELFMQLRTLDIDAHSESELREFLAQLQGLSNFEEVVYRSDYTYNKYLLLHGYIEYLDFLEGLGEERTEFEEDLLEIYSLIDTLWQKNDLLSIDNVDEYNNELEYINTKISVFNGKYDTYGFYAAASSYVIARLEQQIELRNRYFHYSTAKQFINENYDGLVVDENTPEYLIHEIGMYYLAEGMEQAIGAEYFAKLGSMYSAVQSYYVAVVASIETAFNNGELSRQNAMTKLDHIGYYARDLYRVEQFRFVYGRIACSDMYAALVAFIDEGTAESISTFAEDFFSYGATWEFREYYPEAWQSFETQFPLIFGNVYNLAKNNGQTDDLNALVVALDVWSRVRPYMEADKSFSLLCDEAMDLCNIYLEGLFEIAAAAVESWTQFTDAALLANMLEWRQEYFYLIERYNFFNKMYYEKNSTWNIYMESAIVSSDYILSLGLDAAIEDILGARRLAEYASNFGGYKEIGDRIDRLRFLYDEWVQVNGDPNWSEEAKSVFMRLRNFGDESIDRAEAAIQLYYDLGNLGEHLKNEIVKKCLYEYDRISMFVYFLEEHPDAENPELIALLEEVDAIIANITYNNAQSYAEDVQRIYSAFWPYEMWNYLYLRQSKMERLYRDYINCAALDALITAINENEWNPVEQFESDPQFFYDIGENINWYGEILQSVSPSSYEKAMRIFAANKAYINDQITVVSHLYYDGAYTVKEAMEFIDKFQQLVWTYRPDSEEDFYVMQNQVQVDYYKYIEGEFANAREEICAWADSSGAELTEQVLDWYSEYMWLQNSHGINDSMYWDYPEVWAVYVVSILNASDYLLSLDVSAQITDVKQMRYLLEYVAQRVVFEQGDESPWEKYHRLNSLYERLRSLQGDPDWDADTMALFVRLRDFGAVTIEKESAARQLYGDITDFDEELRHEILSCGYWSVYDELGWFIDFLDNNSDANNPELLALFARIEEITANLTFANAEGYEQELVQILNAIYSDYQWSEYGANKAGAALNLCREYSYCAVVKELLDSIDESTWNPADLFAADPYGFYDMGNRIRGYNNYLQTLFPEDYQKSLRILEANAEFVKNWIDDFVRDYNDGEYNPKQARDLSEEIYGIVNFYGPKNCQEFFSLHETIMVEYENYAQGLIIAAIEEVGDWAHLSDAELIEKILEWYSEYRWVEDSYGIIDKIRHEYSENWDIYKDSLFVAADYLLALDTAAEIGDVKGILHLFTRVWWFVGGTEAEQKYNQLNSLYEKLFSIQGDPDWDADTMALFVRLRDFGDVSMAKKNQARALYNDLYASGQAGEIAFGNYATFDRICWLIDFLDYNQYASDPEFLSLLSELDEIIANISPENVLGYAVDLDRISMSISAAASVYCNNRFFFAFNLRDENFQILSLWVIDEVGDWNPSGSAAALTDSILTWYSTYDPMGNWHNIIVAMSIEYSENWDIYKDSLFVAADYLLSLDTDAEATDIEKLCRLFELSDSYGGLSSYEKRMQLWQLHGRIIQG